MAGARYGQLHAGDTHPPTCWPAQDDAAKIMLQEDDAGDSIVRDAEVSIAARAATTAREGVANVAA